jgi:hypothetical protein
MSWAATLGSCGAVYWFKTIYNKPNKKRKTGEFDLGRSTFVYGKKNKWPKTLLVFWVTFFFFYTVLFESLPNTRFICMRVGCPRTRPRHGTFYTKRKKGGPWPTREGIGKNHWTCAEFYYIKRRDWRVYTCVCVQSTQGICLFVLSEEICVWDCVSTGNMENFCFLPQSLEIIGQFA